MSYLLRFANSFFIRAAISFMLGNIASLERFLAIPALHLAVGLLSSGLHGLFCLSFFSVVIIKVSQEVMRVSEGVDVSVPSAI